MDLTAYKHIRNIHQTLIQNFPYFSKVINKRIDDFGKKWIEDFNTELDILFGNDRRQLEKATMGYGLFALDVLKLQNKFDKTGNYLSQIYEDVSRKVYMNRQYMLTTYLPGIVLSQYLWPHHYKQLEFFHRVFVPLAIKKAVKTFCDLGVGTGFFSKEMLKAFLSIHGTGYDISPHSIEYATHMIQRWGFNERYGFKQQDVAFETPKEQVDCILNVYVLEHLENPVAFLSKLLELLKNGGIGFISAAINAPETDHIYLYRTLGELQKHIQEAGFSIIESIEYSAYFPKPGKTAPSCGNFIITKRT